ncbi:MAG: class I SAM-dependent RNA methyltransferase [Lachnospiraceae bacterium]|nr:class I SAM-dependent RNA methyltransferase [Lachnospiraceae bacterium]
MDYELIAPCHFGLESVLKREVQALGYTITKVEDGKVRFLTDEAGIARANIFLRTAERVLLLAAEFDAYTFDELFEQTKAVPWARFLPKDARFWVKKANSVRSRLFSPSDIQSIVKKAIVENLKAAYGTEILPESGDEYPIRISILKDRVTVGIDTSGDSLHKRGYRRDTVKAPITETLAAALLMLTPWKPDRILVDPFCGSGTFLIEAALMAKNEAPGMNRSFTAEKWRNLVPKKCWYEGVTEAMDLLRKPPSGLDLQGYDIDPAAVRSAKENAARAEAEDLIHFETRDVRNLSHRKKYGFIVTNPPYGERISEKEALPELYRVLGERFAALDAWSMYMITSYEDAPAMVGREPARNRKIYNGMLKTYFYEFPGPKPPKARTAGEDGAGQGRRAETEGERDGNHRRDRK